MICNVYIYYTYWAKVLDTFLLFFQIFKQNDQIHTRSIRWKGDSIKAIQLISWLMQKGVKLDMLKIFTAPVLGEMAESLEETKPMFVPKERIKYRQVVFFFYKNRYSRR